MTEMNFDWITDRKTALVTGSASGIGANVAVDLAANGYFIVVTGRDQNKLDKVVERCNQASSTQYNISAVSFRADLHDLEQIDALIQFVKSICPRIDILVNNACWRGEIQHKDILCNVLGGSEDGGRADFGDFKKVMHVNVSVPVYLIQKCAIILRERCVSTDPVVVVNISSIASHTLVPLHTYSISKACLSAMSRHLARCAHNLNIFFITISPGPILTDERPHHQAMSNMTLMNRVGTTQEISNLVLFAIENAILFNGQELDIDGGFVAKQRQADAGART